LNPVASSGELALEGVQMARLLQVLKGPRNVELPSGTLAAGLHYRFAMVRDKAGEDVPWVRVNGANLIVQNLTLAPRGGGEPVLQLAEARVGNANFDLAARAIDVGSVSLAGGKLAATRDVKGTLDWQTLFAAEEGAAVPQPAAPQATAPQPTTPQPTEPVAPWTIGVREIKLADWSARYTDQGSPDRWASRPKASA